MTSNSDVAVRLAERLSNESNGLLSEDDLIEISRKAIEQAFFKDRIIKVGDGYNSRTITEPYIATLVRENLKERVEGIVKEVLIEWLKKPEATELLLKTIAIRPEKILQNMLIDFISTMIISKQADEALTRRSELVAAFNNAGLNVNF